MSLFGKHQSFDLSFCLENLEKSFPGSAWCGCIDNRIEDWRNKEVEVGQQGVSWRGHLVTKSVNEGRNSNGNIKNQDSTDVNHMSPVFFQPGLQE